MKINSKIKICGQSMIARAFVCMTVNAHKEKNASATQKPSSGKEPENARSCCRSMKSATASF